jgi:hypothetical protein
MFSMRVVILSFLASVFFSSSQPKEEMTVLDYYLKVPRRYLQIQVGDSKPERESAIWIKDLKEGYLQAREPINEIYAALKLLKTPEGGNLIAIESRNCTRGCSSKLTLLKYENDVWSDVTAGSMPITDNQMLLAYLARYVEVSPGPEPHLLYTLSPGSSTIDVSVRWSGISLGELEWTNGKFSFRHLLPEEIISKHTVLASSVNSAGDRLQILGITPQLPARLPLSGHLRVMVAYDLKSTSRGLLWVHPSEVQQRFPGQFGSGSAHHRSGSGVITGFFGFGNEAQVKRITVKMANENFENILTLDYDVDAAWEGTMECPTLRIRCASSSRDSAIPVTCYFSPSGLRPDHKLTFSWSLSYGEIMSGQGTRAIKINTLGQEIVTASVEVGGLGESCNSRASLTTTPQLVNRPSR